MEFTNLSSSLTPYSCLITEELAGVKSVKCSLLQQLTEHEFYFISWLGDEPRAQSPKDIDKLLSELISVPTSAEDYPETTDDSMCTYQYCGAGLVNAFLQIKARRMGKAKEEIFNQEKFLDHCLEKCIIPKEYYDGIQFVKSLLKLHISIMDGSVVDSDLYNRLQITGTGLSKPPNFKPFELESILSLKWMLVELIITRRAESVGYLQQMCNLDPCYWVWSYLLCSRTRFNRRQNVNGVQHSMRDYPEKTEIDSIYAAYHHAPDGLYKEMCLAGVCQTLAEILRWRTFHHQSSEPVIFGEWTFKTNEEISKFILTAVKNATEVKKGLCFAELIRYGEILSSIMPPEYRDLDTAENCLRRAVCIIPENSKANHRLGIFLSSLKKDKRDGGYFLSNAVLLTPENFPAWMDFVQLLLSEYKDGRRVREDSVEKVFKNLTTSSAKWATDSQKSSILFLKGVWGILKNEHETAINYFLDHLTLLRESSTTFHHIPSIFKRYSFETRAPSVLASITDAVKEKLQLCTSEPEKSQLEELLKKVLGVHIRDHSFNKAGGGGDVWSRSNPIPMQNRSKYPVATSEADADDCWRNSSPKLPSSSSNTNCDSSRSILRNSEFNSGRRQQNYSSTGWQQSRRYPARRSPSPESWR